MRPVYVSYYTLGTAYESEARQFEQSARAFGLDTDVRGVPNLGDWTRNCAQKPAFIRDRMLDHPGRPIVWLDADARVRQYPHLFDGLTCDFAAHWRHGAELLSGTMFWGTSALSGKLVSAWADAQQATPDVWDQRVLANVIDAFPEQLLIYHLPAPYTRVFDDPKMGEAVIEHQQASRRLSRCL